MALCYLECVLGSCVAVVIFDLLEMFVEYKKFGNLSHLGSLAIQKWMQQPTTSDSCLPLHISHINLLSSDESAIPMIENPKVEHFSIWNNF